MTRLERVMNELEKKDLRQMIVCDPDSIWYLTGVDVAPYERLFALLLQKDKEPVLFVNKLFFIPEDITYPLVWHTDSDDPVAQIASYVDPSRPLGIDKEWPARFLIPLMEALPSLQVQLSSDCVDDCRAIKDEEEKEKMRIASRINDLVISRAKDYVKVGMTEKQVAAFIDNEYLKEGCEGPSFTTIVSFGANAADPHHEPDDTVPR